MKRKTVNQSGTASIEYLVLTGFFILAVFNSITALGDSVATAFCATETRYGDIHLPRDGIVGYADLAILLSNYGRENRAPMDGDLNCDRQVDDKDLNILLAHWGEGNTSNPFED